MAPDVHECPVTETSASEKNRSPRLKRSARAWWFGVTGWPYRSHSGPVSYVAGSMSPKYWSNVLFSVTM